MTQGRGRPRGGPLEPRPPLQCPVVATVTAGTGQAGLGALSPPPPPPSWAPSPGGTWRPPVVHFQGHGRAFAHRRGEEGQDPDPGLGLCVVGQGSAWPGFRRLGPAVWTLLLGFPPCLLVCLWSSPPALHTATHPEALELVGQQPPRGTCFPSIFSLRSESLMVEFQTALRLVEQMTLSEGIKGPARYPSKHRCRSRPGAWKLHFPRLHTMEGLAELAEFRDRYAQWCVALPLIYQTRRCNPP